MLDNKLLHALAAVIEEGGFDKASLKLNLSQSAVSQRIRALEEEVGRVLVVRTTPPEPTPAGQSLLKHLRQIRLLEQELAKDMGLHPQDGFVTLPVGVNADSLAIWFLDGLFEYLRENRIILDLYVDDEHQTHELLKRGEVVGCVATREETVKGCRSEWIGVMEYCCVCTPRFRDAWFSRGFTRKSAAKAPAVMFNRKDKGHRDLMERLFPQGIAGAPIWYVPSSEKFVDVVRQGLAYGRLPEMQIRSSLESGELVELLPDSRDPVSLYWHSWDVDSALLAGLYSALVTFFQGNTGE